MLNYIITLFLIISSIFCWESSKIFIPPDNFVSDMNIYTGLDVLQNSGFDYLKNKNIGLVINQTSVNRYNIHILELISKFPKIHLKKIFTPEHGLKGKLSAGELVSSGKDEISGIEFTSLYGKNKKPSQIDLRCIDLMVFDIQDIGSRYYTYVSTLTNILEACSENNIPVVILDRPNPLGGNLISGPILDNDYKSFVGFHPIPIIHGMTIGELAIMINENQWFKSHKKAKITIIPCINWQRIDQYIGSIRGWVPPSPNIPDFETAKLYSGFCLLEGTNLSEGRGTKYPFKILGAPWFNSDSVLFQLNSEIIYGIKLEKIEFTPISIPNMSKWPKYENEKCYGIKLSILNDNTNPLKAIVELLYVINEIHKDNFKFLDTNFLDNLYGSNKLRTTILNNSGFESLFNSWEIDEESFNRQRSKYLIYN